MCKWSRHQNIVPFVGVARRPLRIVSKWMPKGTLTTYLSQNPRVNRVDLVSSFPVITSSPVPFSSKILDVAEGLAYLHSKRVTHGDLKGVGAHSQPPSSISANFY